jgi:hypothetical protein
MQLRPNLKPQQIAQNIAKTVREEAKGELEKAANSVTMQVSPELLGEVYDRSGNVSQMAGQVASGEMDQAKLKAEADAKLNVLRSRIKRMQEEDVARVRQMETQKAQAWQESQQQLMGHGQNQEEQKKQEAPPTIMGKIKKGMKGVAGRMKHIGQNKTEMGKAAKN